MREFVHKLTFQQKGVNSGLPVAIFGAGNDIGAALDLSRSRLRVGLWPFQSTTSPEVAMGIATILGLLLERWPDVRVYRLFAHVDDSNPAQYMWTITQSQFGVDDWQLEGLDENVAIWGSLEPGPSGWKLTIETESDLGDSEEEVKILTYEASSIGGLLKILPDAAEQIAYYLNTVNPISALLRYDLESKDDSSFDELLTLLFQWELNLYLNAWGKDWPVEDVLAHQEVLLTVGKSLGDDFTAWAISSSVARAMLQIFDPVSEIVMPSASEIVSSFPNSAIPANILGQALFQAGRLEEAYELLEANIDAHSENVVSRLALAELYRRGGRFSDAVDCFQSAIEENITSPALFMRYAELLLMLDYQGWPVEEFVLINPSEIQSDFLSREVVEAYKEALQLDPGHVDALYALVVRLVDIDDRGLWASFKHLVELDKSGDKVRTIVDSMYHLEDISPAIHALRDAIKVEPDRFDLYLNLAVAYLVMEESDQAKTALEKARRLSKDPSVTADIDRLMLSAEDADFEARLGELTDLIGAGNTLEVEDVDFLESSIEQVPTFSEGYILLAKAYLLWDEPDAVLETLLDAQKNLPDDPDILEFLARTLWDSGEEKLAFDYLNKGLEKNPNHVPLLALTGRYLFENGQEDAAKIFLARAEAIAPRHPAVNEARVHIAKRID
jgi:tetratricopeptide (TPR) repeat protein